MELVGRKGYLEEMERRLSNPGIKTMAIWGRRRVGKTALIREFCKGKPHIFLTAVENSYEASMESFGREIDRYTGTECTGTDNFPDLLDRIAGLDMGDRRFVVVIDEYSYLCKERPECNSHLQRFIDHDLQDSNMMLIVCGSSALVMDDLFNNPNGALYKRFIGPIKVEPLPYYECAAFHPGMSEEDLLRVYAIAGGTPLYHILMRGGTIEECIKDALVGPLAPLREEAEALLTREGVPGLTDIVMAISRGRTSGKEISDLTGETKESCYGKLKKLELLGIVESLNPMCGAPRKERIYRIRDGLVRLYYGVIAPNMTAVTAYDRDLAYESILPALNDFYGPAFEEECCQFIHRRYHCKEIGRWWGKVGGDYADIDIIALCENDGIQFHLVCECKFRNKMTGEREARELELRTQATNGCFNPRYCIFSRSGFTDDLEEYADDKGIILLTPMDMFVTSDQRFPESLGPVVHREGVLVHVRAHAAPRHESVLPVGDPGPPQHIESVHWARGRVGVGVMVLVALDPPGEERVGGCRLGYGVGGSMALVGENGPGIQDPCHGVFRAVRGLQRPAHGHQAPAFAVDRLSLGGHAAQALQEVPVPGYLRCVQLWIPSAEVCHVCVGQRLAFDGVEVDGLEPGGHEAVQVVPVVEGVRGVHGDGDLRIRILMAERRCIGKVHGEFLRQPHEAVEVDRIAHGFQSLRRLGVEGFDGVEAEVPLPEGHARVLPDLPQDPDPGAVALHGDVQLVGVLGPGDFVEDDAGDLDVGVEVLEPVDDGSGAPREAACVDDEHHR